MAFIDEARKPTIQASKHLWQRTDWTEAEWKAHDAELRAMDREYRAIEDELKASGDRYWATNAYMAYQVRKGGYAKNGAIIHDEGAEFQKASIIHWKLNKLAYWKDSNRTPEEREKAAERNRLLSKEIIRITSQVL